MSRMTATDIVGFIRKGMGNPTTDEWDNTELLRFANLAQNRIAITHRPPELISSTTVTTSDGTYDYELTATDVLMIEEVRNTTTGLRLEKSCLEDWMIDNQDATIQEGDVVRWFEYGVGANSRPNIRLWLCPDGTETITIYYIKRPTELVLTPTATSSILREQWDELIMQIGIEIGLGLDQQRQAAGSAKQFNADLEARVRGRHHGPERAWSNETRVASETKRRTGR